MIVLVCGLTGFGVCHFVKTFWRTPVNPLVKVFCALAGSEGASFLLRSAPIKQTIVYGFSGMVVAMLTHKLLRYLSVAGDYFMLSVMKGRR